MNSSCQHAKFWCLVLAALLWLCACTLPVSAQEPESTDRVWVAPSVRKPTTTTWESQSATVLKGRIRQFNEQSLIVQTSPDGSSTEIASDRIDRIEFQWATSQAEEAISLVEQKLYAEAISKLEEAVRSGVPRWQQRFLISALVRCVVATDNMRTACILFTNLAASKPPPMLYADMPLVWTVRETPKVMQKQARQWLVSSNETEQLLAASWLLFDVDAEQALTVLRRVQQSENPTLRKMANAQSWRLSSPPETLDQLPKWLSYIETLPQPLRIGPTEFVADRLMRIGELDLAIGQWVRIASLHPDRYHRAANALKTASQLLERQDRKAEAERLNPWIEKLSMP